MKILTGIKKWKKALAAFMAVITVGSFCLAPAVAMAAQQAEPESSGTMDVTPDNGSYARSPRSEVVQLNVHSRVSGAGWTPVLDLSDAYMRTRIDFYVQYKGDLANELIGDHYAIQWICEDGTVLDGSPENAGKYTAKIILDDSLAGIAEMAEDTFSFTIRKLNLTYAILGLYHGVPGQTQWTGEPVMPGEPYLANSEYRLPEDTYDLEFVEGKNCTDVGMAYVKAVAIGPNVEGEKEFRYQIVKAQLDREYFKERMVTDFTYDGTAKQPLLEGNYPEIAEVQYLYYFNQWNQRLDGAPEDTGSYSSMVRLIPRDTEHYQNDTWTQEFEIAPRKLGADVQVEKSRVYDGGTNMESPKVTISNLVEGDEVDLSATARYDNRNAGRNKTITVSYQMSGKDAGKYLAPDELLLTDGEILPKEIEVGNIVLQSYYYNGSREVPLDETSITDKSHWTLVGSFSSVDDVALDLSEVRAFMEDADVGVDKPVTFSGFKLVGADSGNYTLPQPGRTVTIRRIGFASAYKVRMDDYQYTNAVPQPQLLRYKGDGQVAYKYREADSGQAYREWKDIGPETLKPGKYEMIAEISDTLNYECGTTVYPTKFSVSRFSPQVTGSEKWQKTYGDEAFYLDVAQKGDGELRYQLIRGEDVVSLGADGKVTILKAGEARVYVSAEQTEFYEREGLWIDISVAKISKPDNTPTKEQTKIKASSEMEKVGDISLPKGWSWKTPDAKLIPGGVLVAEAVYEDTDNYEQCRIQMEISKEAEIMNSATDRIYTIGKDDRAVIKCTGALSEFKGVTMDGVDVAPSNYTLQEGSTILTFSGLYLNQLLVGSHTVSLAYTTVKVEMSLTVKKEEGNGEENPPTDRNPQKPSPGDKKPGGGKPQKPGGNTPQKPGGNTPQIPTPGGMPKGNTPQNPNPIVEPLSGSLTQAQDGQLLMSKSSEKPASGEESSGSNALQNSVPKESSDSSISHNSVPKETADTDVQTSAGSDAGTDSKSASNVKTEKKGSVGWYVLLILALAGLFVFFLWKKRRKK